jgi:hypothetical protein
VFGFGKGHYSYINPEREWQQTTGFFGKAANAQILLQQAAKAEGLNTFPAAFRPADVTRFEFFRHGDRPAGVWVVRQGPLHFALPITTGTKPGVADYLPAPHGLIGFDVPAEQTIPALTPYIELASGRTWVAGDSADEIRPSSDGRGLTAVWKRWAPIGGKSGQLSEIGLTASVTWTLTNGVLLRSETIEATRPVQIQKFSVAFPTTGDRLEPGDHIYNSPDLQVGITKSSMPMTASIRATGNTSLSHGSKVPVLLLLQWEARDVSVRPGSPLAWELSLRPITK